MELKLTTVYLNVDAAWMDWWMKNNAKNYGIRDIFPQSALPHEITSKDPTSDVMATTRIELIANPPEKR